MSHVQSSRFRKQETSHSIRKLCISTWGVGLEVLIKRSSPVMSWLAWTCCRLIVTQMKHVAQKKKNPILYPPPLHFQGCLSRCWKKSVSPEGVLHVQEQQQQMESVSMKALSGLSLNRVGFRAEETLRSFFPRFNCRELFCAINIWGCGTVIRGPKGLAITANTPSLHCSEVGTSQIILRRVCAWLIQLNCQSEIMVC